MSLQIILAAVVTLLSVDLCRAQEKLWPPCNGNPLVFCAQESSTTRVCGTNGRTYPNKCMLCLHQWVSGKCIQIAYVGACRLARRVGDDR
ncbi:serine protease inhibitor Kazal-type 1-like isoform X1 [Mobula hypostoma]|uniref:serine protease inhibitor Kazal-type 1-like isoform X1 n=1 Tax=Mobula hypostoma TaxID=723540 RepID=UPI002FC2B71D